MNRVVLASLAALFTASIAFADRMPATGRSDCLSVPSKILGHPVAYCVLLPPSYDADKTRRYPVLYLLHGLGDNEQVLIHSGGFNLIQDLWDRHQLGEFLVVSPAGAGSFYINSHDGHSRYEDFFIQDFLTLIQQRYRTLPGRASRGIAGISMGGYGALHLAFRHARIFGSVGAHSAALIEKLPVMNSTDSRQLTRRQFLGNVFGAPVDPIFWKQNDPIAIARSANLAGLQIYFDCGSDDDYGFDAGAQALDKVLTSRHIPHEFHLYPGGHSWIYFAEHLPALLQFHSSVFTSASAHGRAAP
ncbi:MAG TPA: alpha/beta hydrolase-fold protein [Candidatus Dormibacteraeota bacterium]|nr:alpha/beta hydrolase-fold protein [Candidatus Dormibacteraeota bacterium]